MKPFLLLILFLSPYIFFGQQDEERAVREAVERFFDGFHKQDSVIMKSVVGENPILQTIGKDKEGKTILRQQQFDQLIKSIVSIPDSVKFEERITDYKIRVDGEMANAWTPYEFWINGQFSHCGVNSFQMLNKGDGWKIIYLVDTRRKANCQD